MMAKPMTKTEWMNWLEKAWGEAQQREWVGLTDEEVSYCRYAATFCDELDTAYMAELIEQALKEKNNG